MATSGWSLGLGFVVSFVDEEEDGEGEMKSGGAGATKTPQGRLKEVPEMTSDEVRPLYAMGAVNQLGLMLMRPWAATLH